MNHNDPTKHAQRVREHLERCGKLPKKEITMSDLTISEMHTMRLAQYFGYRNVINQTQTRILA